MSYVYPESDPHWVEAIKVTESCPGSWPFYVNVTEPNGMEFKDQQVHRGRNRFDPLKPSVLVEHPKDGWLIIEFEEDDVVKLEEGEEGD